jgi:hypothetical protein
MVAPQEQCHMTYIWIEARGEAAELLAGSVLLLDNEGRYVASLFIPR